LGWLQESAKLDRIDGLRNVSGDSDDAVGARRSIDRDPGRGSDDVAAVAAEVDVRGGHLPASLLLAADVRVVGVETARRRTHEPCPRVAEAFAACSLEGSEAAG